MSPAERVRPFAPVAFVLLLLAVLLPLASAFPADHVTSLPYLTQTPAFDHYSGYLSLGNKHFHYWFVESENDPDTDPLLLWVNGGPGCSSHYGLIFENGPFEFCVRNAESIDLCLNEFSWNKIANVLYLESPIGVGYSWSPSSRDYSTNDTQTALDNYAVLQVFFTKFPQYQGREFYISGESYAGIYIPTLAEEIRLGNQRGENFINLQGFLVGNGVTDPESDSTINSLAPFSFGHGLISQDTNNKIKSCNGGATPADPQCVSGLSELSQALVNVNRYQIYDDCYYGRKNKPIPWESMKWGEEIMSDIPCINTDQASMYFNLDEVKEALHVEDIQWEICSNTLRYTKNLGSNSYQFYPALLENYRAVAFSGDTDAAVPHVGTELWTRKMARKLIDPWRQWRVNNQVAGYVVTYDRLWYVTYKGGTHTVPESHPEESLYMLSQFFKNEPL